MLADRHAFRRLSLRCVLFTLFFTPQARAGWQNYGVADGLGSTFVRAVREDHAGNLWFGTQHGVSRYDGSTWQNFGLSDGLPNEVVSCEAEDRTGRMWVGTPSGLAAFDGHT